MDEEYHRAVKPNINFWLDKEKRLTSAVFKDSNGLSVDKRANRSITDVTAHIRNCHQNACGHVYVTHLMCTEKKCRPIEKFEENNPFHCEIHGETTILIDNKTAKQFAKICTESKMYSFWDVNK